MQNIRSVFYVNSCKEIIKYTKDCRNKLFRERIMSNNKIVMDQIWGKNTSCCASSLFCQCDSGLSERIRTLSSLRSREYRFTHMNCSIVDIPFLTKALSGERIWVILKIANLMRKVWWLWQEEKEKNEKKLFWRFA